MRRALSVLVAYAVGVAALAGEIQPINQTVVINDTKVTLTGKAEAAPLFEVRALSVYDARAAGTDEACTVVAGQLVSHLPSHLHDVTVTVTLDSFRPRFKDSITQSRDYVAKVHCPVPDRPVKFVVLGEHFALRADSRLVYRLAVTFAPYSALKPE